MKPYFNEQRHGEVRVPVAGGVNLSMSVSLPTTPEPPGGGYPVILDCHPYRKDDLFAFPRLGLYEFYNDRGFATARLDVRGTGRSGGRLPGSEYSAEEIDDAVAAIDWISRQPWCSGSVGMWGISWSAINTLIVAARQPPALKACIAVHPSDELFASDIHFVDGLLHFDLYELSIDLLNSITPAPEYPLDEQILAERFDQPPWMASWLAHQENDEYWRSRSLAPNYDRVKVPVLLVGGWYDGYHSCVFRLLDRLKVPVEACVGPWRHVLPHMGGPGAPADWLRQSADWWDRWLRPGGTSVAASRRVSLFARGWHPPAPDAIEFPGEWRTVDQWPVPGMGERLLHLRPDGSLHPSAGGYAVMSVDSPPWTGPEVGHWWGDVAYDQQPVDNESAVFETPQLAEGFEILGAPQLSLPISAPPGTHVFARLEDIAPDGRATLVTGVGGRAAGPLEPITLRLHWTSWRFDPGHRVRLSISTALWPMFWPARCTGPIRLRLGGQPEATLLLPVPPAGWGVPGGPPEFNRGEQQRSMAARRGDVTWDHSHSDDRSVLVWSSGGMTELEFATMRSEARLVFEVSGSPRTSASAIGTEAMHIHLGERTITWQVEAILEGNEQTYEYRFKRELRLNGETQRQREWRAIIPRAW